VVEVKHLLYKYENFTLKIDQWAFDKSQFACVLGSSGSGKSTLLQILAGFLKTNPEFQFSIENKKLENLKTEDRSIGFVFQDYRLFPHLTALENILIGDDKKKNEAQALVSKLNLGHVINSRSDTLSGGEAQRVALARALIRRPSLVLLDEPLSALDDNLKTEARFLLSEMQSEYKIPFIMVTHDLRDVRLLSQSLLVLEKGQVVAAGDTAELLDKPKIQSLALMTGENCLIKEEKSWLCVKKWGFRISQSGLNAEVLKVARSGAFWDCKIRLNDQILLIQLTQKPTLGPIKLEIDQNNSCLIPFDHT
jgi:ABC-type sugar transport system ATPase subunit